MDPSATALDGGWGYACVAGMFQSQMLFGLVVRTFGVLYLVTMEKFQTTATVVSWIGATCVLAWGGFSPVASIMCHKYGCRKVAAVGSLLQCIGFLVGAFASHVAVLYVGFGLFVGCGVSCSTTSGYLIVSMYFHKKRAIATAIASTGSSLAVFCMPPLVNFLADYYGFQGCLIILSGMSLQILVSAALFRPLETRKVADVRLVVQEDSQKDTDNTNKEISNAEPAKTETQNKPANINIDTDELLRNNPEHRSTKSPIGEHMKCQIIHASRENIFDTEIPTPVLQRKTFSRLGEDQEEEGTADTPTNTKCAGDNSDKAINASCCTGARCSGLRERIQLLTQEPVVAGIIFLNFTIAILSSTYSTFIAALAKEQGYKQSTAVLLISIGGIADIIGRISTGFIMDSDCVRHKRLWLYTFCAFVSSSAILLLPLVPKFYWYSIFAVINSSVMGTVFGQRTTVLADILGVKRMAPVFGVVQLVNALGLTCGMGLGGVLRDQLDTYEINFYVAGLISLSGCICLLALYTYKQISARVAK